MATPVAINMATNASFEAASGSQVEVRRNRAYNPRGVSPNSSNEYNMRWSAVQSWLTGISDHPVGITTATRATLAAATGSGRGIDLYGNYDVATYVTTQPVTAGVAITVSTWVRTNRARTVRITARFHTGSAWVAAATAGSNFAVPANTWTRVHYTVTPPVTSTHYVGRIEIAETDHLATDTLDSSGLQIDFCPVLRAYHDYAIQQTPDSDLNAASIGTVNASASILRGPTVAGGSSGTGATPIQSSQWFSTGSKSLRVIPASASSQDSFLAPFGDTGGMRGGLVAGKTYTLLGRLRLPTALTGTVHATRGLRIVVFHKTAVSGYIETPSTASPNVPGEYEHRLTFTLPSDATEAFVRLYNGASLANGDVWWDDFFLIEGEYTGPFFYGDTPDTPLWEYAFTGAANASTSTQSPVPRVLVAPALPDPLRMAPRRERYRVDLMTNRDGTIGQLDGVSEVSLDFNASDDGVLTAGGSLNLDETTQTIDWLNARCQPWATVNGQSWPLGVYLMSAPTVQHAPTGLSWDVTLKDKLSILDEDWMAETYSLNTGQNVVDAIRQVIADAGEANHAISPDPRVLNGPLTWPANTSRLTIVQDLLKLLNYAPLWVDGWGAYIGEPFVDPQNRPVLTAFEEGLSAIHLPTFQVTKDVASVPNRLIGVSSSSSAGLVVTADNNDPTNIYSIPARNRVIARSEDFDTTDLPTLAALVSRRMRELMAPASVVEFQHAVVPLDVNSVVRFVSDGVAIDGVVLSTSVTLAAGQLMQTTIQEVVRVNLSVS